MKKRLEHVQNYTTAKSYELKDAKLPDFGRLPELPQAALLTPAPLADPLSSIKASSEWNSELANLRQRKASLLETQA